MGSPEVPPRGSAGANGVQPTHRGNVPGLGSVLMHGIGSLPNGSPLAHPRNKKPKPPFRGGVPTHILK